MPIEQKLNAFRLVLSGDEMLTIEFEDDLDSGTLVEVLRQLAGRLADLADYYEVEGTDSLLDDDDDAD